jgi:hypothetical protein
MAHTLGYFQKICISWRDIQIIYSTLNVRFEVLTVVVVVVVVVLVKIQTTSDFVPCQLVNSYRHFGGV